MEKSLYSLDKNVLQERISRLEKLIDKETDPIALKALQLELGRQKAVLESLL
jgi:hypothetical protein|nr:MAG TPA_asm: hypothetical protein [Bacteriophage sp.]DAZ33983.1 MAG TPA: hypothetical protein [Caudoviricetes sp.]